MPLVVHGYREFMIATQYADKDTKRAVRDELRQVGDIVKHDVQTYFSPISSKTAGGFRTRVRQRSVVVEQSVRKVTGDHPEYGALQMRSLIRAQHTHEDDLVRELEQAMDRVCDRFERTP